MLLFKSSFIDPKATFNSSSELVENESANQLSGPLNESEVWVSCSPTGS